MTQREARHTQPVAVGDTDTPPARPRGLSRRELGFERQPAVRWFNPGVLARAGMRTGLTSAFGSFLDKRELQSRLASVPDQKQAQRPEIWLDYVADSGDGFNATYTVASQVAQRTLRVAGVAEPLPRGHILVLGGDQVYPTASAEAYENRFAGPYRAAFPWTNDEPPKLLAVPGNHDWYDGLTSFLRLFGQPRWVGGWQTCQARSYFAVQLPHRWWLWGIDVQFDMYVDEPQLDFFESILQEMERGDRLILATAVPSWIDLEHDPNAYRNLAYLERKLLSPAGIDLKLTLTGDWHHYARYSRQHDARLTPQVTGDDFGATHKITAGGGGAFLHPTHVLPRVVEVAADPQHPGVSESYELASCYPDRRRSRLLALRALALPFLNPHFPVVPGLLLVALFWTTQFGIRSLAGRAPPSWEVTAQQSDWVDLTLGLLRNPVAAVNVAILVGALIAFAQPPPRVPARARVVVRVAMGTVHAAAQVAVFVLVALLVVSLVARFADGAWFVTWASVFVGVVGGLAASVLMGAYLAATNMLRTHGNETFSAARIPDYKNFLRLHIDRTGRLTVYAIGIDRVVRRWRPSPDATDVEASYVVPDRDGPRPRLIDKVTIG